MTKRRKTWSHSEGERGMNRVRAFEKDPGGDLYLEWHEDEDGVRRRRRLKLDHRDRKRAADQARKAAARLLLMPAVERDSDAPLSIRRLLDQYEREVTPTKGESKQGHDKRARRLFLTFFDGQPEPARRATRHPATLDRVDWDRFISARRSGAIEGWGAVKDRQVQYDLVYLIGVLNWGLGVKGPDGNHLLRSNPWGEEVRRAQRWEMPKERNPRRVGMTDEVRELLIEHSPSWQFELALWIQRYTRRRNSQIRRLLFGDLDMQNRRIRWRSETEKSKRANWTPMPEQVYAALRRLVPEWKIGEVPVFASATNPEESTSRHTFQVWLRRAKKRAGVKIPGLGFHSEKRAGVRDPRFRSLPARLQEELTATNYETLRQVYDEVSFADLETAQGMLDGDCPTPPEKTGTDTSN